MAERIVKANGIEMWTEDFGDPSDPAVLLVMGASAQGIFWPDEFCDQIVAAGRYVIRFDNRDVGQSTCFDFATDPYTLPDMARDAVGVLDAYGIECAHVVGASMGGMICQTLAIEHPERVISFTSIMSSPGGGAVAQAIQGGEAEAALPAPTQEVIEAAMASRLNPPTSREARIEQRLHLFRILSGSLAPYDEAEHRALFEHEHDRARNWDAQNNHGLAVAASSDRRAALSSVKAPALVIHGTEDPILPYEHGVATANAIPGCKLLTIEKMDTICRRWRGRRSSVRSWSTPARGRGYGPPRLSAPSGAGGRAGAEFPDRGERVAWAVGSRCLMLGVGSANRCRPLVAQPEPPA